MLWIKYLIWSLVNHLIILDKGDMSTNKQLGKDASEQPLFLQCRHVNMKMIMAKSTYLYFTSLKKYKQIQAIDGALNEWMNPWNASSIVLGLFI